MTNSPDILIIGAGMAGAGAAARLAPHAKVTILEMEDRPAYHTTGRSAAMYIRNYGNDVVRVLNAASEDQLRTGADVAEQGFLSARGEMAVALRGMEEHLAAYLAGADGLEEIDAARTCALLPVLRPDLVIGAALEPNAADIDVDALFQAYLRKARGEGAEVVTKAEVTGMTRNGGVWEVETRAGDYQAPVVINAAGAWGDVVAGMAGVAPVGLQPLRRSIAVVPAPDGVDPRGWPTAVAADETWFCPPDGGRLWISPADEDPVAPHDAWAEDETLALGIDRFQQATTVEITRLETSWAGLRTFAPDRTPVNGFEPGVEGFFWLVGQGGYGIQTAPAMSQLAADLVLGHEPCLSAEIVQALSPQRFR